MEETVGDRKSRLRAKTRALRRSIDPDERAHGAQRLAENLVSLSGVGDAPCVLAYRASSEEISLDTTVALLRERGVRVLFPRVAEGRSLVLHEVSGDEDFEPGAFGISEPRASTPMADLADVRAVFVPGLAFDGAGGRLGYGGGYYDTLLPRIAGDCLVIGVCFDEQVIGEVPRAPHDVLVDLVVTPSRVIHTEV